MSLCGPGQGRRKVAYLYIQHLALKKGHVFKSVPTAGMIELDGNGMGQLVSNANDHLGSVQSCIPQQMFRGGSEWTGERPWRSQLPKATAAAMSGGGKFVLRRYTDAALERCRGRGRDIVEVRCEDDGLWYQAIVEHENSDGTFTVRFDKDGYEYHYPLIAWRVPKTRHFIEELEEGEVLNGRVTEPWSAVRDISSTGFYVDVGAEDEGFVHISEIKEGRVSRIEDEVRIGQDVSLRVLSARGKLTLSMKPPATGASERFLMGRSFEGV
eukprot:s2348_g3.t1